MANSLRIQLRKLVHEDDIDEETYQELIKTLDGHDKKIKANVIDEFAEYYLNTDCLYAEECLNRCFDCLVNKFKEQFKEYKND